MQKVLLILSGTVLITLLCSCMATTPQEYFEKAALNSNLLYGFAGTGMQKQLESPPQELTDEKTMTTAPMKRTAFVNSKLELLETNYNKIKKLKITDQTAALLSASSALYEFVLPVYRNEYLRLAGLYDDGGAPAEISILEKHINNSYEARFLQLYNAVWAAGKSYAANNGIRVVDVDPAPSYKQ